MTESSTICVGDELFSVLADLRARGCDVWSLDAAVGCNAGYRVSFSECSPAVAVNPRDGEGTPRTPERRAFRRENAISTDESPERVVKRTGIVAAGGELTAEKPTSDVVAPAALSLETRLQKLYEKAVQSGRVRTRFKASTRSEHARLPHKDD